MQQRGFTLIELIIVIVILGILAVTAAPRFINLSSDATASTLQGVKAAVQSGAQLVYAKSAIAGQQADDTTATPTPSVNVGNVDVPTKFGYPSAASASNTTLPGWVQLELGTDFTLVQGAAGATTPDEGSFAVVPGASAPTDFSADTCHVLYTDATSEFDAPDVTVEDSQC